jgi:hypothetical protein
MLTEYMHTPGTAAAAASGMRPLLPFSWVLPLLLLLLSSLLCLPLL